MEFRRLVVRAMVFSIIVLNVPASSASDKLNENVGLDISGDCWSAWDDDCALAYTTEQSSDHAVSVKTINSGSNNQVLEIRLDHSLDLDQSSRGAVHFPIDGALPGQTYEFTAWVKAVDLKGNLELSVSGVLNGDEVRLEKLESIQGPSGYSTWIRIALIVELRGDSRDLRFTLSADTNSAVCKAESCGSAQFDNVEIRRYESGGSVAFTHSISNVCDDAEFLDFQSGRCVQLDKHFGYKNQINGTQVSRLSCIDASAERINQEIKELTVQGGTLLLAPCIIKLDQQILLASDVTLSGSGSGQTRFQPSANWDVDADSLIKVHGTSDSPIKNVVLRDFSILGSIPSISQTNNIQIRFVDNLLIERLEVGHAAKSGITYRSSRNVTIRYVASYGSVKSHGISSKDCYIGIWFDGTDLDSMVSLDECSRNVKNFWTQDVSVHSNWTFDNNGLGINSHGSYVEMAGNIVDGNGSASKFTEPAHHIWVHHNRFSNSAREGVKIASLLNLSDQTMVPHMHVFYSNIFANNNRYGLRIHERAWDIFLLNNTYIDNGSNNKLRIVPGSSTSPRVFVCVKDEISDDGLVGSRQAIAALAGTDAQCDVELVSRIF